MRYAIDKKPMQYTSIEVLETKSEDKNAINAYNSKYGTNIGY
jgi:hypothetical protein